VSARTVVEQVGAFLCQNDGQPLDEANPQGLYVRAVFAPDVDELRVRVFDSEGVQIAFYTAILQEQS
jgi:hypothetical protein